MNNPPEFVGGGTVLYTRNACICVAGDFTHFVIVYNKVFAAEVGRESMKNEPGVRVLYSVQEKKDPTKFTILEIYADDAAYKHHIGTAHFKKYKEGTIKMVKDLQLIDCNPLVPEALIKPAK